MKKKVKHEYVVGYSGDGQAIYGKRDRLLGGECNMDPLTERQAMSVVRGLLSDESRATIYRLVPVKTMLVSEWKKRRSPR